MIFVQIIHNRRAGGEEQVCVYFHLGQARAGRLYSQFRLDASQPRIGELQNSKVLDNWIVK